MLLHIFLTFLALNPVHSDFLLTQYNIKNERPNKFAKPPNWKPPVVQGFKAVHKVALNINQFNPGNTHSLDHVYSWKNIRASVNDYIEVAFQKKLRKGKKPALRRLVNLIFEVDDDAQVKFNYFNFQNVHNAIPPMDHEDYLDTPIKLTNTISGVTYNKIKYNTLSALNTKWKNEALAVVNDLDFKTDPTVAIRAKINRLLEYLNSAPANLRYGHFNTNSSIQEKMDFMGDANGNPTKKEKALIVLAESGRIDGLLPKAGFNPAPKKIFGTGPIACTVNFQNKNCIKSSTGTIQVPNSNHWFMVCPNNIQRCNVNAG